MGIAKPAGGYAEQMLEPGGWPDVDEDTLYDRAQQYTQVLRQVTGILETCQHQRSEIFDGGVWSGAAANAANSELATDIGELMTLQNGLTTIVTWGKYIAQSIVQAKADIIDNVENAHQQINVLERDASLDAEERETAINEVVVATYGANISLMEGTAEMIRESKAWKPPGNALEDLLDQKIPPPVSVPDGAPQVPPPLEDVRPPGHAEPTPVTPPPVMPANPPRPSPTTPVPGPRPSPAPPPAPGMPATPGIPATPGMPATPGQPPAAPGQPPAPPVPAPGGPGPAVPGAPGAVPATPGRPPTPGGPATPAAPLAPATPAAPLTPAASTQPGASAGGKGVAPASAAVAPASAGGRAEESSASAAPAAAAGMPAAPMGAGSGGGSGGSGARAGARPAAPVGQKQSSTPPTRPAAAARPTARPTPAAQAHANDHPETPEEVVAPPPIIPVSAARAERDAVADAADASRRGGRDPVQLARRIGAALNAPGNGSEGNLGFFWVTAVTTDGAIVVANSYGLAYIPDGVQLPDKVHMASADDTIPPAERSRWATYPVMAVQGWANHHDKTLRAVIATEQQFAGSDPGSAKIVLTPDDIPATGAMAGRSRLQVVDPDAAERLAATSDPHLVDLLPPAPAGARQRGSRPTSEVTDSDEAAQVAISAAAGTVDAEQLLEGLPAKPAEVNPLADERPLLWFDVVKPMASKATGRTTAHLRAFHKYTAHSQEVALGEAHAATDLAAQRSAVADWLYWKRLTALLDAAFAAAS